MALTASPAAGAPAAGGTALLDAVRVLFIVGTIGSFTSPPVANIALGLALLGLCAQPAAWWRVARAARQPLGIGALVLLLVMTAAMLWADADWRHRFGAWWNWRVMIWLLLASAVFDEARWKERFCLAIVGWLSVAALASFALRLLPNPVLLDDPGVVLRNHTTQGMAMAAGTVLALALAFTQPYRKQARGLLFGASALFVANLLLIATGRSGHLALLVCVAAGAFLLLRGRRRWIALALVPVVAALLASSTMVRTRFETAYQEFGHAATAPSETPMGLRAVIWSNTLELIGRRPWFGYGVGGFAPAFARVAHERYAVGDWHAVEATDTHNQYLHLMVEAGVPGLLALLAFVSGALRQPSSQPYRACGLALLAAWLATNLFNSHFQTFNEGHMIALLLGALLGFEGGGSIPGSASAEDTAAATSA